MNGDGSEAIEPFSSTNDTTKVYYHLDDSATPYMSEVPVSPDRITLGDFKAVFTRKGYRYFCRRWDEQLKSEVKAELVRDQQRLQRSPVTGLFELFLLSPAPPTSLNAATTAGAGSADTLPRTRRKFGGPTSSSDLPSLFVQHRPLVRHHHHLSALALSSIVAGGSTCSEPVAADPSGGQRVSMVTDGAETAASSGTNTLISKRAGEHLAELYNSTSEEPYTRTTISSGNFFRPTKPEEHSLSTDRPPIGRQKRRKGRHRRPYVPSTISSASDESSSSLPRIEEVRLRLQEAQLGISVASQDGSIFIYSIQPGSAAEKCGCLEIGDQIVQVEGTKFEELDEKQALDMLRRLNNLKKTVTIYVAKRRPLNVGGSSSDKSDALSQLCETVQLDISQWVESTKQAHVEPVLPFVDVPVGSSSKSYKSGQSDMAHKQRMETEERGTSDEEQAAYMDRRNGVGPRFVSAVQKAKLKQQQKTARTMSTKATADEQKLRQNQTNKNAAAEPVLIAHHHSTNHPLLSSSCHASATVTAPSVPVPLHAAMEPSVILRRMAHPRSGLDIRDRKWLKIPVPNSFIGDDMLDWLMCNVQGFRDRKCARAFASAVLLNGLIKHVVNVSAFNEKCYYIFNDSILAERLRILRQENKQPQKMEGTTEDNGNGTNGSENRQPQQPESTTEITYMSSPSSPFFGALPTTGAQQNQPQQQQQMANCRKGLPPPPPPQLVIANNPKYAQSPVVLSSQTSQSSAAFATNGNLMPLRHFANNLPAWPISPIPRDCLSPETNEYASMVQGEINCGAQFDAKFDGFLAPPTTASKGTNFANNNNNIGICNGISVLAPHHPPLALLPSVPPVPQRQILKPK